MFYKVNNINLFVKVEGTGQPTLVFLHFWGGSSATWNGVTTVLKEKFKCISYDSRGWGKSDKPDEGYSIESLAADTTALINNFNLKHYILVGHSMGGKVAQYIAAQKPAGLIKLILVAPSPSGPTILPELMAKGMKNAYTTLEGINDTIDHVFKAGDIKPELREELISGIQSHTENSRLGWTDIALREDVSEGVDQITVPTLIIAGENDMVDTPERLEAEVHAFISTSKMVIVSGVGHLSMLQKPEKLAELINEFIS
ncbi:alpha/beta fold hydrolase [Mucilaginibacter sp. UYCu711]|uniref:alpha/beta fold hydrolase n=1 Tax=Mucilaginibacter sp. UYCu711 TaxID=3156339 RepID=UPI003D2566FE